MVPAADTDADAEEDVDADADADAVDGITAARTDGFCLKTSSSSISVSTGADPKPLKAKSLMRSGSL